ncbi:hypothetical protein M5K25_027202 [Dendrobium thyrsiflorum]|uniref:Uncharacterized protein n=1 Tax=Dendrobium thyrsiflorum TaxID=117978 RepID=A0ABD0TZP9_DENTH
MKIGEEGFVGVCCRWQGKEDCNGFQDAQSACFASFQEWKLSENTNSRVSRNGVVNQAIVFAKTLFDLSDGTMHVMDTSHSTPPESLPRLNLVLMTISTLCMHFYDLDMVSSANGFPMERNLWKGVEFAVHIIVAVRALNHYQRCTPCNFFLAKLMHAYESVMNDAFFWLKHKRDANGLKKELWYQFDRKYSSSQVTLSDA